MLINLTNSGWTLLASQGQSVELQNLTPQETRILVASTPPAAGSTDGEVMYDYSGLRRYAEPLPANLYGVAVNTASTVEVMPIGSTVATSPVTLNDRSGNTGAANGWSAPFGVNTSRQYARISNPSSNTATIFVWDKTGTPVQAGARQVAPGGVIEWAAKVPGNQIQVMAINASVVFEAAEG